jgi:hypothetical protein
MKKREYSLFQAPKGIYEIKNIKGKRLKKKMEKINIKESHVTEKRGNSRCEPVWLFNGMNGVFISKKHAKKITVVKIV